jgi:PadR family transcriptional regulator AphA
MPKGDLNTTSYLILGLLVQRDWSAYEIAAQMDRGLGEVWPLVERQRYNAPKKLVEQGLATLRKESVGRRSRTIYSITPAGKQALVAWLATESRAPSLAFEGIIRLLLAVEGTIDDLRATLVATRDDAVASRQVFLGYAENLLDPPEPIFPEREHLLALANRFMVGHFTHIIEWSDWALAEVDTWADTTSPATSAHERTMEILRETRGSVPGPEVIGEG